MKHYFRAIGRFVLTVMALTGIIVIILITGIALVDMVTPLLTKY